ncbi:aspartyl/asparaginyl beta-hydroxylase domain-containing protein [Sphingosinicella rhizophila]|uniref:Aspartyl/asparaginyl beta-hydroxylase domain-containing protein n=1 Tax=Sphingosinicella rhizophila TaxID=3050082 RepID=A0ABU3QC78_9SPHN|nr:aspartyl/asparaginyl beta-hydroxylase domain-containing protein [Sphingosinicella sp. GR2756]MDT9600942.1 aspartyl/asparaginyl beta-hydroxylase domain-containing protein [Sphingosinicella sp. GR2756]
MNAKAPDAATVADLLSRSAVEAERGRPDAATALLREAAGLAPDDPLILNRLGNMLLAGGHAVEARAALERAVAADPGQPALLFNLAAAARGCGDVTGAIVALDAALAADPYFVQALFQKAVALEEIGRTRDAARTYKDFLDTAPPEILGDARFRVPIDQARAAVDADSAALARLLGTQGTAPTIRAREAQAALLGETRIFVAEPTFLTVPRLPAIPFFDRTLSPWMEALEAEAEAILEEAREAIAADAEKAPFRPYVANPPGTPLNQWRELDHNPQWGALFFWKHGVRDDANCRRCPRTAAVLDRMPMPDLGGRAPNAMFSLLRPHTRIPPHTGVTNLRATVHLPLVVPDNCGFRVGAETRSWEAGRAWMFDDSIEHEAWNDSDSDRLILIFDTWNPFLEPEERDYFAELLGAYDLHYGRTRGLSDTL